MPVTGDPSQEVMQALHALLAESLVLWGVRHRLQPLEGLSAIVLCDEAGAAFVSVEPQRPPSDMIRWSVTKMSGCHPPRPRACSSILGVLETVRAELDVAPAESSSVRLGASPGVA
jgi:hypothetical protein